MTLPLPGLAADIAFLPHGYCLSWNPLLLWTLVVGNLVVGISYYSIPLTLAYFVRRQRELRFNSIFLMFAVFIFACGTGHFINIVDIWYPVYRWDAAALVITAGGSAVTAVVLWLLLPKVVSFLDEHRADRRQLVDVNSLLTESLQQLGTRGAALADSERRTRLIVTNAPNGLAAIALDGSFISVNQALCNMLAYTEAELLRLNCREIIHPDDLAQDQAHLRELLEGKAESFRQERRYYDRGGRIVEVQQDVALLRDQNRQPVHFIAQIQDISHRKQAEQALHQNNARLERSLSRLTEHNREITVLGELGEILQACEGMNEISAPIGRLASELFPDCSGSFYLMHASGNFLDPIAAWGGPLASEPVFAPQSCWAIRKGNIRWNDSRDGLHCRHLEGAQPAPLALCVPMNAQGDTLGLLYLQPRAATGVGANEAEERRDLELLAAMTADRVGIAIANIQLREKLRQQSIRDPLTGLFNRRYLEETLPREVSRAGREKSAVAVLMIDVDHFKSYNDTYGHDVGDDVLRSIGRALLFHCRECDLACRYGGEEFALVLTQITPEAAVAKANALREQIKKLGEDSSTVVPRPVTISVGVAACPNDAITAESVLKAADQALYQAKKEGRDRVVAARRPTT